MSDELLDVCDEFNNLNGVKKNRKLVHRDGDWHRCSHVWMYVMSTQDLLIQKRSEFKDSFPGKWDISAAGHVISGSTTIETARQETFEELGVQFPKEAFEPLFTSKICDTQKSGAFVNNEFADVFLVTVKDPIPISAYELDEAEVDAVTYVHYEKVEAAFRAHDPSFVPADLTSNYGMLFDIIRSRAARRGLIGSGIYTFFHEKRGHHPVQIQCLTFDEAYLKLIPADKR